LTLEDDLVLKYLARGEKTMCTVLNFELLMMGAETARNM
jgi:hypothetical protein